MDKAEAELLSFRQAWLHELHGTHDPDLPGPLNLPGDTTVPELHGTRDSGPPALLSLPGELRNQIYDWVIEPCEIQLRLSSVPDPAQNSQSVTNKWSNTRRTALALTQTCRELRAEVLPLHNKAHIVTKATIRYNSSANEIDLGLLKAINFNGPVHHSIVGGTGSEFDILALSKTAQGRELHWSVSFETGYGRVVVQPTVRNFIANRFPARLRHSIMTAIRSAKIVRTPTRPRLVIVVRPKGVQPWMPFHGNGVGQAASQTIAQWLRDVGLDTIGIKQGFINITAA